MIDTNALRLRTDSLIQSITPPTPGGAVTLTAEDAEAIRVALLAVPMIVAESSVAAHLASEYAGGIGQIQHRMRTVRQQAREQLVIAGETIETFDREGYTQAIDRFSKDAREASGAGEIASIGLSILLASV